MVVVVSCEIAKMVGRRYEENVKSWFETGVLLNDSDSRQHESEPIIGIFGKCVLPFR